MQPAQKKTEDQSLKRHAGLQELTVSFDLGYRPFFDVEWILDRFERDARDARE